jgi:hypothetical protein
MNRIARAHQQQMLREARVLDALRTAPPPVQKAQAHRVFDALRKMLAVEPRDAAPPARRQ